MTIYGLLAEYVRILASRGGHGRSEGARSPVIQKKDDSRERFLLAAEQQFMEHGYRATTIRAICAEAGTSLAILNRNWPSKEALFAEMLKRHFDPLHEAQGRLLEEVLAGGGRPSLSAVIAAFYAPAFARMGVGADQRTSIYSRALIDPSREIKQIVASLIEEVRARLIAAIGAALPGAGRRRLFLVMNLVLGGYVFPQAFGHQLATAMEIDDSAFNWAEGSADIVTLLCSGLDSHVD